jgi:hypothetical protein
LSWESVAKEKDNIRLGSVKSSQGAPGKEQKLGLIPQMHGMEIAKASAKGTDLETIWEEGESLSVALK